MKDYTRVNNIVIHGVPAVATEAEAFAQISKVAHCVGVQLRSKEIDICHSLPDDRQGRGRVICKFLQRRAKVALRDAIRNKKPTARDAGIAENDDVLFAVDHICPATAKLFSDTKRLLWSREGIGGKYRFVWLRGSRILIRFETGAPVIEVKTAAQLTHIAAKLNVISNFSRA